MLKLQQSWQWRGTRFPPIPTVLSFPRFCAPIHTYYSRTLAPTRLGHHSLEFCSPTDPAAGNYSPRCPKLGTLSSISPPTRLPQAGQTTKKDQGDWISGRAKGYHSKQARNILLPSYPMFENNPRSSYIPMFNPIAQYVCLFFKISGARDEAHVPDNLFSVTQAQSNIPGSWSGNTGDHNTHGSFNNINTFMLPSVADFGV